MKSILAFVLLMVFALPALSQNNINENFVILRGYHQRIASSLSLECVWYLSSLFGENKLLPSLPESFSTPIIEFLSPSVPQPFFNQQQLATFFLNPNEINLLSTALTQCETYGDSNSVATVFLYNLLRNYIDEQQISTSAGKIYLFF